MKTLIGISLLTLACGSAHAAVVTPGNSGSSWLGFMNVFELPSNGGAYVFGNPWGVADLNTSFNDVGETLTLSPNTIGDPSPFWYTPVGGPGAAGNKIMEANLYVETTGVYTGQTLTFQGNILSNTFTSAHEAVIFIKDFAPDYSSSVATIIPITPGPFSISLATLPDPNRHVQYGFQVKGVNVWFTDTAPFGNVVVSTAVPVPGSAAALLAGTVLVARRRRR